MELIWILKVFFLIFSFFRNFYPSHFLAFNKPPGTVITLLKKLRPAIGNDKLIVTSPMNVNVWPSWEFPVPDKDTGMKFCNNLFLIF